MHSYKGEMSSIFPLCHGVMCGEAALACSPSPIQPCVCKALFNGPDCTGHYFTDNTAAFWALNSLTFLAFLGLFVFAVFLLLFWFTRLVPVTAATVRSPTSQAKNPQLYGVFLMAIGTLLRIVYGIVMLAGMKPLMRCAFFYLFGSAQVLRPLSLTIISMRPLCNGWRALRTASFIPWCLRPFRCRCCCGLTCC